MPRERGKVPVLSHSENLRLGRKKIAQSIGGKKGASWGKKTTGKD